MEPTASAQSGVGRPPSRALPSTGAVSGGRVRATSRRHLSNVRQSHEEKVFFHTELEPRMKPVPALLPGAEQKLATAPSDLPFGDLRTVTLMIPHTALGGTENTVF